MSKPPTTAATPAPFVSFDEFDERHNPRPEPSDFENICEHAISRRRFLGAGVAYGTTAFVMGAAVPAPAAAQKTSRLTFDPVAANTLDTVTVPDGYNWHVVARWGDSLWSSSMPFDHTTRGTGASQELAFGDNNDGMSLFQHRGKTILAANNEYVNLHIAFGNQPNKQPKTADDVRKGKAGHGVTVCELMQHEGTWSIVRDSPFNRRITADTPMEITGPARGHKLLKTMADPQGIRSKGTWNNCGNGRTPWGTYLTCEENFNGYFSSSDDAIEPSPEMKRYGIGKNDWGYAWAAFDQRFDIAKHPNECNRAGYVVEVDPTDPNSTPQKLTALGRFKHENAELIIADSGHVVVYMGDDEGGEYLYKFVSSGTYSEGGENRKLLENGHLYAARFSNDMRGEWIKLTPSSTSMKSQAEICIHTRIAASAVGATTMDRPEWIAAHPTKPEVYCSLTNNKNRGKKSNKGGADMPVGGPNPRAENKYGQIVRWRPDDNDHTANAFTWDLFVMAGNPTVHNNDYAGSSNISPDNMFNSPDGLAFDSNGQLWILTDGKYTNEGDFSQMGNNQMLIGDPGTGEIKRFMVGPRECEVTGITWSPDKRTVFVGIQHPGEHGNSHFPEGGDSTPRSSIIAISKNDGSQIG